MAEPGTHPRGLEAAEKRLMSISESQLTKGVGGRITKMLSRTRSGMFVTGPSGRGTVPGACDDEGSITRDPQASLPVCTNTRLHESAAGTARATLEGTCPGQPLLDASTFREAGAEVRSPDRPRATNVFRRAAIAASLLALACGPVSAETREILVPKSVLVSAFNAWLAGAEINLDNWGGFRGEGGGTWHVDASFVSFPSGGRRSIDLPRSPTVQTAGRRFNAYVNDMASRTIDVKLDGELIKGRLFFESAGDEIKVGCVNRRRDEPCKAHLLKHTGQIDNAHVFAWLRPTFDGARLGVKPVDLKLDFDFTLDSWILDNMKNVAEHFVDIKGLVEGKARGAFFEALGARETQRALTLDLNEVALARLTDALRPRLGDAVADFVARRVSIDAVRDRGSSVGVTFRYPDIVTADSVRVVAFAPKSRQLRATCPFNFGFDATIDTKTAASGTAWVEGRRGRRQSAVVGWQMPKAGRATSAIARRISGDPGDSAARMSRLVVSWKDSAGSTQLARSPLVRYDTTCLSSGSGPGLTIQ